MTRQAYPDKRYVREFKFENAGEYAPAQDEIKADIFAAGDKS